MVATSTMKEFFNAFNRGESDETTEIVKSLLDFPANTSLYVRSPTHRQWSFRQSGSYTMYVTFTIHDFSSNVNDNIGMLSITVQGGFQSYNDGLDDLINNKISVKLDDFRTCKEALEAVCNKFVERFKKPASRGNVKVFYDESEYLWCWKRPNSSTICYNSDKTKAYHVETCLSAVNILGEGVVPDERRFISDEERRLLGDNRHPDIRIVSGQYYFKIALVPIYKNQIPFNEIHSHVPASTIYLYEFVIINDEKIYINLKRPENSLLSTPVHSYSTRIESLVSADKLFLLGKTDLYSKRDKTEVPFLGWELEACSNLSTVGTANSARAFKEQMPWLIMCKNDGSISPEGFETVSVPATLDFWKETNLSSALDSMRVSPHNMRSYEHNKCGFHVHVSRSALSVLDLQKLERFVHNPENNDFITTVAGRKAGTYQKYSPDLFNNRKKWLNSPKFSGLSTRIAVARRLVEEDITYFFPTRERIVEGAIAQAGEARSDASMRERIQNFNVFFGDFVSYDSLTRIILHSSLVEERFPGFYESYDFSDVAVDFARPSPRYLSEMCGSASPEDQDNFFRFLIEEVICVDRPRFSAVVQKFFPEWNLTVEEAPVEPEPVDWKIGLLKSSAPYRRSQSSGASHIVKGPVGKGVNSRYDALNTTNKNTVEFRMFKGTMNGTTIMRYLEFTDALVRFVASTSATDAGLHYSAFVLWLQDDSFNVARYEHLVSFLTENNFLSRKNIRRKTLPVVVSTDKNVQGLVAAPAKGFKEILESKPIGSFSFSSETVLSEAVETNTQPFRVNLDVDVEEEDDDYGGPNCQCDECRRGRGEID